MNALPPRPPAEQFHDAIVATLGVAPKEIIPDGEIHRFPTKKNGRDDAGWYVLHDDNFPAGSFGNWSTGESHKWSYGSAAKLSGDRKRQIQKLQAEREKKKNERQRAAARHAQQMWEAAPEASPDNPYLKRKGVGAHGARQTAKGLIVPVIVDGEITSIQTISAEGDKLFLESGAIKGGFFTIGDVEKDVIVLAEGFATAASIHEATSLTVVVAFNAGNLAPVAKKIREERPLARIIIAADDDWKTEKEKKINPGIREGRAAARAVDGLIVIPRFDRDAGEDGTDWNDFASLRGLNALKREFSRVLSEQTAITEQQREHVGSDNFVSFGKFRMDAGGLYFEQELGRDEDRQIKYTRLSGPFEILGESRDTAGSDWGKLIRFRDSDGRQHTRIVTAAKLHGDYGAICAELASEGLQIDRTQHSKLVSYLCAVKVRGRATVARHTGWIEAGEHSVFVLPDESIGPPEAGLVVFDGAAKSKYSRRGTLEQWRDSVCRLAAGHSLITLAISAAFVGPLLYLSGQDGGGIHFVGKSSRGKTTAQRCAASVWGKGDAKDGVIEGWRKTVNGSEGRAAAATDILMVLDEIGDADPRAVFEMVYAFSSGVGKDRSRRDGSAQDPRVWRVFIVSSGEVTLQTKLAEDKNRKARAGQFVRLIDIPIERSGGLGMFDHPGPTGDVKDLPEAFASAATSFYGTAGPAFVRCLIDRSVRAKDITDRVKSFVAEYVTKGADPQVSRVANRLGLIAAAGELAAEFGIVAWPRGEAIKASAEALASWIEHRGGTDAEETRQHIAQVRLIIEQHGDARFQKIPIDADKTVNSRLGWRSGDGSSREWWIPPEIWKSEICAGLNPKHVSETLASRGMLSVDRDGNKQARRRLPGEGQKRFYVLNTKILGEIESDDEDRQ